MFSTMVVLGDGSSGSLTLQLGDISGGINLVDVSGLDPVKATLTSSNFALQAGAVFQSARREARNITIKMGVVPDPATQTVSSIKRKIYSVFREGTKILMKFYDDDPTPPVSDGYQIYGYVETCTGPIFTQDPEVNISVMCFDPNFFDSEAVTVTGLTTADAAPTAIDYAGTTEAGLTLTLNVNRSLSEFQINQVDADGNSWTMDVVALFEVGDVVTITTMSGNRTASLLRAGVTTSIVYAVSPQATWLQLSPGSNTIQFVATGAAIPASLSYKKLFGSVE